VSASAPRTTFTTLRARREALHVASDILYEEPIDVRTVACSGCGGWLDVRAKTITDPLTCPACSAKTPLPGYLRAKYIAREVPKPRVPMGYIPSDIPDFMVDDPVPLNVPRWLIWLSVLLALVVASVAVALLAR
jgi:hypothetical protein